MYTGLVISNDNKIRDEVTFIIKNSGDLKIRYLDSIDELDENSLFFNYLFILISDLDHNVIKRIIES